MKTHYLNFKKYCKYKFRILSTPLQWYYYRKDEQQIRITIDEFKEIQNKEKESTDLFPKQRQDFRYFRVLAVRNYHTKRVEIAVIDKIILIHEIHNRYIVHWRENPMRYDIYIDKTGSGINTKYDVSFWKREEFKPKVKIPYFNLKNYFKWLNVLDA